MRRGPSSRAAGALGGIAFIERPRFRASFLRLRCIITDSEAAKIRFSCGTSYAAFGGALRFLLRSLLLGIP